MKNTTMKINCWKLENGNEVPMPPTATLDGFQWNGRFRITVSDDDGSLGLPFLFAANDTAIMTVETSEQKGTHTGNKKIKQILRCVPRSLGEEVTCSRIRSHNGNEHVWSEWELASSSTGTTVEWDSASCIDSFVTAGVYNITGERLNASDGLPIENCAPGHTISARLTVLNSSITGTGESDDKCITQILSLSNRTGGDGDVYIRTGHAHSTNMLVGGAGWEPWGKLQQNIEVGQVTSLNSFTGNGIYSGVYTNGSTFFETFVMVVINNYAVAGATGQVRSISQFKYALNVDSTFSYKTRTGRGGSNIEWGSWVDLGAATTTDIQDNSITAQKLSSDVREKVENPLRPLYIAAGAEYNDSGADKTKTAPWGETVIHKAGYYYLNGLGDITERQMMDIYNESNHYALSENISNIFFQSKIRTNICKKGTGWISGNCTTSARLAFYNSYLEVAVVANPSWPSDSVYCFQAGDVATMFDFCNNLKRIVGVVNVQSATEVKSMLSRCPELLSVKIIGLHNSIIIKNSPNIEVGCIVYMIQNAAPTTAITITLHPDAYARLADDADVVAALEAQPLISLVSA